MGWCRPRDYGIGPERHPAPALGAARSSTRAPATADETGMRLLERDAQAGSSAEPRKFGSAVSDEIQTQPHGPHWSLERHLLVGVVGEKRPLEGEVGRGKSGHRERALFC